MNDRWIQVNMIGRQNTDTLREIHRHVSFEVSRFTDQSHERIAGHSINALVALTA